MCQVEELWPDPLSRPTACRVTRESRQKRTGNGPAIREAAEATFHKLLKRLVAGARNRHYLLFNALRLPRLSRATIA
jgi:hypothetical protein